MEVELGPAGRDQVVAQLRVLGYYISRLLQTPCVLLEVGSR